MIDGDDLGQECEYRVSSVVHPEHGPAVVLSAMLPWTDTTGPLAVLVFSPQQALEIAGDMTREAMRATGGLFE